MESSGICCTGPVGPDGKGGSGAVFFAFRCVCDVVPFAGVAISRHNVAAHRTRTPLIFLNFNPVLITTSSTNSAFRERRWAGAYPNFRHRHSLRQPGDLMPC